MRERTFYAGLAGLTLPFALGAVGLAGLAIALGDSLAAAASASCSAIFAVPGLIFLGRVGRIRAREAALTYVGSLAEARGVLESEGVAEELHIPVADAERILRKAIEEGYAKGDLDGHGRFVASTAPRCPSCADAVPRSLSRGPCPGCGIALGG